MPKYKVTRIEKITATVEVDILSRWWEECPTNSLEEVLVNVADSEDNWNYDFSSGPDYDYTWEEIKDAN